MQPEPGTAVIVAGDLRQAGEIIDKADALPPILVSTADVEAATSLMARAKVLWKAVEDRRVFHKGPLDQIIKKIDATAKKVQTPMKDIETKCKAMLGRWKMEQEIEKQRREDEAMQAAEEEGRETPDLTVAEVNVFVPTVKSRQLPRVRITDESLLERKYLMPNIALIEQDVKAGLAVPGAELYYQTSIVNS